MCVCVCVFWPFLLVLNGDFFFLPLIFFCVPRSYNTSKMFLRDQKRHQNDVTIRLPSSFINLSPPAAPTFVVPRRNVKLFVRVPTITYQPTPSNIQQNTRRGTGGKGRSGSCHLFLHLLAMMGGIGGDDGFFSSSRSYCPCVRGNRTYVAAFLYGWWW